MGKAEKMYSLIATYLQKEGVSRVGVFGSYARGEERSESDLDLLVRFSSRKTLLELVRMERELSELVGKKIDLLTERSISSLLIDNIKKDEKVIYEC